MLSALDNLELLVALDSINPSARSEDEGALVVEAKERGLLIHIPVDDSEIGRREFRLGSLSDDEIRRIFMLVTRANHNSYMGLQGAVLEETEKRSKRV